MSVTPSHLSADNLAPTLQALRDHFHVTDGQIGRATAIKRSTVQAKISSGKIWTSEVDKFAYAFNVPVPILLSPRDLALRWVLDHPEAADEARRRLGAKRLFLKCA